MHAQVGRGGSEWLTARGDAQRTSWIRSDALISVPAMSKPGFALQWKTTLENTNRGKYGLGSGVSAPGVTLFVPTQLVTGSSNNVYAIDSDTGYVVWQRHFDATLPAATDACPGGTLSAATRIVSAAPPALAENAQRGGGGGRATQGYRSVLGQPGEGAPVDVRGGGAGRAGAPQPGGRGPGAPANAAGAPPAGASPAGQRAGAPAPGRGGQGGGGFGRGGGDPIPGAPADQVGGGGGLGRPSGVVYAISSDGVLHVMGLQSGKDLQKPAPFLPANSRWSDPIAVGTTLYTSTSGGCGGAPNAVWAIDLESQDKPVVSWKSGGPIIGSLAFTSSGTLIAVTGPASGDEGLPNAIVALNPKTLKVEDSFSVPRMTFASGPMLLKEGDLEWLAVGRNDGHVMLINAEALYESVNTLPRIVNVTFKAEGGDAVIDSLASWQEPSKPQPDATPGTRWILLPKNRSLETLKIDEPRGLLDNLVDGWTVPNLANLATPIIVNGVAFALEGGRAGSPAVLHAYVGTTGKELWTSGKTMTAAAAPGSFWSAFGQIYVGTMDGTLYAFGFNDERK